MTSHLVCNLGREILWEAEFILQGLDLYHYNIIIFGGGRAITLKTQDIFRFQTICSIISKRFHFFSDFIIDSTFIYFITTSQFTKMLSTCLSIILLSNVQLFMAYQRSPKFACYRAPCPEAAGMARRWRLEFDAASDVAGSHVEISEADKKW